MEVQLSADQRAFARRAVEAGRLQSEEDAVREALALWEDRERRRISLVESAERGRATVARGEGRVITQQSLRELGAEMKERGRARYGSLVEADLGARADAREGIRQGLEDMAKGRHRSAREFFAEFEAEHGMRR